MRINIIRKDLRIVVDLIDISYIIRFLFATIYRKFYKAYLYPLLPLKDSNYYN